MTNEEVEKIIKSNINLQINLAGIRQDFEEALAQPEQGFTYEQMKEHAEGLQRDYDLLLAEYNLLKQDLITVADIEKIIKFKERNK